MLLKDARKAVERLEESGVPREHADAIVDLLLDADERVATQQSIEDLEARLTHRLESQGESIRRDMSELRTDLTRTIVTSVGAAAAFLAVLVPLAIYFAG